MVALRRPTGHRPGDPDSAAAAARPCDSYTPTTYPHTRYESIIEFRLNATRFLAVGRPRAGSKKSHWDWINMRIRQKLQWKIARRVRPSSLYTRQIDVYLVTVLVFRALHCDTLIRYTQYKERIHGNYSWCAISYGSKRKIHVGTLNIWRQQWLFTYI